MNNVGTLIVERENLDINIERLAAQRELYALGKIYFNLQIILNLIIPVLLITGSLILAHFYAIKMDWVKAVYGFVVVTLDYLVITTYINQYRQKAALIQEAFDCDVLNIEWNKIHVGEKPLIEDIKKYSDKYKARVIDMSTLKDWYATEIKEIGNNGAKVICQRSNFSYDYALRKRFITGLVTVAVGLIILLIFFSTSKDMSLQSFFLFEIVPYAPILSITQKLYKEHSDSIKTLESLKSSIHSTWASILKKDVVSEQTIRQIQDKIYSNRKSSPLIPEWIYSALRPKLEKQMYYSVNQLVKEYMQNNEG
jgi:SMODS-associating 4TM effector domain